MLLTLQVPMYKLTNNYYVCDTRATMCNPFSMTGQMYALAAMYVTPQGLATIKSRHRRDSFYKPYNKRVYPRLRDPYFGERGWEITKRISYDFR